VQSGPLHEPDHFIDVRKLLAKPGSPRSLAGLNAKLSH